ncbi:MAG: carbamoyltransferase HypF [Sulfurospirillaceae bacterium]
MSKKRVSYKVEGLVQGVGFRPFVYTLATKLNLTGFIKNSVSGVYMELQGEENKLKEFLQEFHLNLPPLARVDKIIQKELKLTNENSFKIEKSANEGVKHSAVLPDMSLCKSCEDEMRDSKNRRYHYPFTNCTNCGPRYSIIESLPYDRPNTSMKEFKLCKSCEQEYNNPLDRRYHAQPISCPHCGPKLSLNTISSGVIKEGDEALKEFVRLIKNGEIVALKGMGGFHIICDARNIDSLKELRVRKKRVAKPFAIMCKDIKMALEYVVLSKKEEAVLNSIEKPIVLVKKKKNLTLPQEIAPKTDRLGIFLPYTPLHFLLFEYIDFPLIATSANRKDEPIVSNELEFKELKGIVEFYLNHDRKIVNRSDDSIVQLIEEKILPLRISRGYAPFTFPVKEKIGKTILAVGAQEKNSIALLHNGKIIQSPYIGDISSLKGFEFFNHTLKMLKRFYEATPDLILHDNHPNYTSTLWAKSQNIQSMGVYHHQAHICATMLEHGLNEPVLGVSWDGTGYGEDGTIWGGEFLLFEKGNFKRVAHFEPFKLLGGEGSIKHIWRVAYSMLKDLKDVDSLKIFQPFKKELPLLDKAHLKNINSPLCSSVGRIFDAVAFLATGLNEVTYDGESGLLIESLFDEKVKSDESFHFHNSIFYYKNFLKSIKRDGKENYITLFVHLLANSIICMGKKYNLPIVISGGVFQNKTLVKTLLHKAKKEKIKIYFSEKIPLNDSGIAFGQLAKIILAQ